MIFYQQLLLQVRAPPLKNCYICINIVSQSFSNQMKDGAPAPQKDKGGRQVLMPCFPTPPGKRAVMCFLGGYRLVLKLFSATMNDFVFNLRVGGFFLVGMLEAYYMGGCIVELHDDKGRDQGRLLLFGLSKYYFCALES